MKNFYQLPNEAKVRIFEQISARRPLPAQAVEKDWWVVQTLRIIFEMGIAQKIVFKGGTSLSKAWGLIERFSEDIDLTLNKSLLGFGELHTKKQVKRLRSQSFSFISGSFFPLLKTAFENAGLNDVQIQIMESTENDPVQIEIYYPYVTMISGYVKPRVLIEIGSRSLCEPFSMKTISSLVNEHFHDQIFADKPIHIPTVNPEKTLLEKIFLMHEEFQKPIEKIRTDRLSRHLYDIVSMMDTQFLEIALKDKELYQEIVLHRKLLFSLSDVDYSLHQPQTINPVPPVEVLNEWEKDYRVLCENMIYGKKPAWNELLTRINELKKRINSIDWKINFND